MNKITLEQRIGKSQRLRDLADTLNRLNVNVDVNNRWENGIEHHPKSEEIYQQIADIDWLFGDDHFGWESGGDGDNGEALMYLLDIIFDLEDLNQKESND